MYIYRYPKIYLFYDSYMYKNHTFSQKLVILRLLSGEDISIIEDNFFQFSLVNEVSRSFMIISLDQFREIASMRQVGVLLSLAQEVISDLLVSLEEVFVEGRVSSFLEVLVLDILQVSSLLGRSDMFSSSLDGFSLGLDSFDNLLGSFSDLVHKGGVLGSVSDELVIRTGRKGLTTELGVVHEDGFEVLEGILAGSTKDSEIESGIVEARKSEALIRTSDIESSHEGISPIVELEDKSVVVLEVEDRERSHGSEDGSVTSHFLDFGFFEEKDFDTLSFTRFEIEGFHCSCEM